MRWRATNAIRRKIQKLLERLPGKPPILTSPPEFNYGITWATLDDPPYFSWVGFPGITVTVVPAVWDESDGAVVVTKRWRDPYTNTTLATGETFTPTVEHLNSRQDVQYVETASRNGSSRNAASSVFSILPVNDLEPYYMWTPGEQIRPSGNAGASAGQEISKSSFSWVNPLAGVVPGATMDIDGRWVVNGVEQDLGVETYTPAAGECIVWRETATNVAGSKTKEGYPLFVQPSNVQSVRESIVSDMLAAVEGKTGGDAGMRVFTTMDHTTPTYVRNTNLWASGIVNQLTGCAAWKGFNGGGTSYGGVMITPRHMLYCAHAHPHAENTWIYPSGPCPIRFVQADNTLVTRTQIWQEKKHTTADLCIAVLDSDVPAGIHIAPMLTLNLGANGQTVEGVSPLNNTFGSLFGYEMGFGMLRSSVYDYLGGVSTWNDSHEALPMLAVSQGFGRVPTMIPPPPASDYPAQNNPMVYIRNLYGAPTSFASAFAPFYYNVYDGDSGTPVFALVNGQLVLMMILTTAPWGGVMMTSHLDFIDSMIHLCDTRAVAAGRMTSVTGYTVTRKTPEQLLA